MIDETQCESDADAVMEDVLQSQKVQEALLRPSTVDLLSRAQLARCNTDASQASEASQAANPVVPAPLVAAAVAACASKRARDSQPCGCPFCPCKRPGFCALKRAAAEPAEKVLQSSVPAAPSVSAVPDPLVATTPALTPSPTRVMTEEDRAVAEERASVECCIRIHVIYNFSLYPS